MALVVLIQRQAIQAELGPNNNLQADLLEHRLAQVLAALKLKRAVLVAIIQMLTQPVVLGHKKH